MPLPEPDRGKLGNRFDGVPRVSLISDFDPSTTWHNPCLKLVGCLGKSSDARAIAASVYPSNKASRQILVCVVDRTTRDGSHEGLEQDCRAAEIALQATVAQGLPRP
jgi:hypothetical protein